MLKSKQPDLKKTTNDWRLTIFGEKIYTPPEMLPRDQAGSPHYEEWKKERKHQKAYQK